jgi:serine/threonine protein kinase
MSHLGHAQSSENAASTSRQCEVFISYSHKDANWKDWILSGQPRDWPLTIKLWSDDDISPNEDWNKEITSSLEEAKVAVLLVSRNFLDSQFIRHHELQRILKGRKANTTKVLWVPLEKDMSGLGDTRLSKIQAAWSPESPLNVIRDTQPEAQLTHARDKIFEQILRVLDPDLWNTRKLFDQKYDEIKRIDKGGPLGVYSGWDPGLQRYVSIVKPKRNEDFVEFQESLRSARKVEGLDCFMTVYETGSCEDSPFCVRQYIEGTTLYQRLLKEGKLRWDVARDILLRLGKAIDTAHKRDFFHLNIKPSNILVDGHDRVYLSVLSRRINYFDFLKNNWGTSTDHPSREDYAYAIPEFFVGFAVPRESYDKCDQYLLGLLGYHMITGQLPQRVKDLTRAPTSRMDFCDLQRIDECEGCRLCPKGLADSIMRMASLESSERFDSLSEAVRHLELFRKESLTLAKESYRRVITLKNGGAEVFQQVYDEFIPHSRSKRAKEIFKSLDWNQQFEMLTEAVLLLLVFCEFDAPEPKEPTVLSRIATRHSNLDLDFEDLDLFQNLLIDAFVRHDPACQESDVRDAVKRAWRESLQPGIQFMKQHVQTSPVRPRAV